LEGEEKNWFESLKTLRSLKQVDGEYFINNALKSGKKILAEGAQGSMLDIDFGTYPFVTSSNTVTAGVCIGLGIAPSKIGEVIGISKAYCTRVGAGPFPTELHDEMGDFLRKEGMEFGATTGRPRRCGWIDLVQLRYTIMLNGVTQLVVTKIDVLNNFSEIKASTNYLSEGKKINQLPYDLSNVSVDPVYKSYEGWNKSLDGITEYDEMPSTLKAYIDELEKELEVPVTIVSTGPERQELVMKGVAI
jgi:adenylosuccinate synthase